MVKIEEGGSRANGPMTYASTHGELRLLGWDLEVWASGLNFMFEAEI